MPTCIAAPPPCCSAPRPAPGLRTALEAPDRIDELFVERAAQPVGKRLHVLAGEEKLTETVTYTPNAAGAAAGGTAPALQFRRHRRALLAAAAASATC